MVILTLLIFFLTRVTNLLKFPIFADEAIYIRWSQYILNDWTQKFIPLTDGKPPLHMWLMIPYLKFISDPLLAGRLFSVTCGIFSLLGIYLLTKELFNKQSAFLAAIFYLFLPYPLTYDRMALTDGPLLMFMIWFIYSLAKLTKKINFRWGIVTGLLLGLAFLTKPNALFFYPFLAFSLILFNFKEKKNLIKLLALLFLAFIVSLSSYGVLKLSPFARFIFTRSSDYSFTIKEFLSAPVYTLGLTLGKIIPWIFSYYTLPVMGLFVGGVFYGLVKKNRLIIFLFTVYCLLFTVNAVFGRVIYPRYFLIFLPAIIPVTSFIFLELFKKLEIDLKAIILFLILLPSFYFDYFLIFKPLKTPFVLMDREQHLTDWSSGIGIREIAQYFKKMPNKNKIWVYTEGFFGTLPDGLAIFLNNYGIGVDGVGVPVLGIPEKAFKKIEEGNEVYLVANSTRVNLNDPRVKIIKEFPKPAKKDGTIEKLILFKINK